MGEAHIEETLSTLTDLVRAGKIHALGLFNVPADLNLYGRFELDMNRHLELESTIVSPRE